MNSMNKLDLQQEEEVDNKEGGQCKFDILNMRKTIIVFLFVWGLCLFCSGYAFVFFSMV